MKNRLFLSCVLPLCTVNISYSMFTVTNPLPKKVTITQPRRLYTYLEGLSYGNAVIQAVFAIESLRSFFLNNKNLFLKTAPYIQMTYPKDELNSLKTIAITYAELEKKLNQNEQKKLILSDQISKLLTLITLTPVDEDAIKKLRDAELELKNLQTDSMKLRKEEQILDAKAKEPKETVMNVINNHKAFLPNSFVLLAKALGNNNAEEIKRMLEAFQNNASSFMTLQGMTNLTKYDDPSELLIPLFDQMREQSHSKNGTLYKELQKFFPEIIYVDIHNQEIIHKSQGDIFFTTNKPAEITSYEEELNKIFYDTKTNALIDFVQEPQFLVFHIPRFYEIKKDKTALLPPLNIDLTPYIFNKKEPTFYSLKSAITHVGKTLEHGYYVTHAKYNDTWWKCSDYEVKEVVLSDIEKELSQASIFIYELASKTPSFETAQNSTSPINKEIKQLEQSLIQLNSTLEKIAKELNKD